MAHRRRSTLLGRGYDRHADSPRVRFRRALVLCLMTIVAPGSAQVALGKKWVGWLALTVWVALIGGAGYLLYQYNTDRATVLGYGADADLLKAGRIAMIALAVGWIALFVDAWRLGYPFRLNFVRASVVTVLNTAIVVGVMGTTAMASQLMTVQRDVVTSVFTATETVPPLKGRYNILLMGADSGPERLGVRPDSMTVASIDATTGRTVLISLPRNLQNVPFSEDSPMRALYPYGYNCGSECLLNAVHTLASNRTDLYPDSVDPGLDATIDAVEGVTDLRINYYVMVNMEGFRSLVDAVGGVELEVPTRIAMFGHDDAWKNIYIEPGLQTLTGQQALWYARSRVQSDDYTRMGRQKCLMSAMVGQLSPQKVIRNATKIGKSSQELLDTNIPAVELGQFADLALKSRGEKIGTVSIVPPTFSTVYPDYPAIQAAISKAIAKSEKGKGKRPSTSPTKDATQREANETGDLASTC